VKVVTLFGTLL